MSQETDIRQFSSVAFALQVQERHPFTMQTRGETNAHELR